MLLVGEKEKRLMPQMLRYQAFQRMEHRNTIDAALLSFLGMDEHNIIGVQSIFDIQLRGIFLVNALEH